MEIWRSIDLLEEGDFLAETIMKDADHQFIIIGYHQPYEQDAEYKAALYFTTEENVAIEDAIDAPWDYFDIYPA